MRHTRTPRLHLLIAAIFAAGPPLLFVCAGLANSDVLSVLAIISLFFEMPGQLLLSPIWWHHGPGFGPYIVILVLVNFAFYYALLWVLNWWNTRLRLQ